MIFIFIKYGEYYRLAYLSSTPLPLRVWPTGTDGISFTCKLIGDARSQASPQTVQQETVGMCPKRS